MPTVTERRYRELVTFIRHRTAAQKYEAIRAAAKELALTILPQHAPNEDQSIAL